MNTKITVVLNTNTVPYYHISKDLGDKKDLILSLNSEDPGPKTLDIEGMTFYSYRDLLAGVRSGALVVSDLQHFQDLHAEIVKKYSLEKTGDDEIEVSSIKEDNVDNEDVELLKKGVNKIRPIVDGWITKSKEDVGTKEIYERMKRLLAIETSEKGGARSSAISFLESRIKRYEDAQADK